MDVFLENTHMAACLPQKNWNDACAILFEVKECAGSVALHDLAEYANEE